MVGHYQTGLNELAGKVLISHPLQDRDSIFHKSVVYLYQHNPAGSIGLLLNKPSTITLHDLCKEKNYQLLVQPHPVHTGGPVSNNSLIMLHSDEWRSENTAKAYNNLLISSDNLMVKRIALGDAPTRWRIFGGLCGWAPGQLQAELNGIPPFSKKHRWMLADPTPELIFDSVGEHQWNKAIELSSLQLFNQYF